jgi:hypothetical protein
MESSHLLEEIGFVIISRSISPISAIFFLFCRGCEELYNKKMLIEIESQNHEIIAKTFFFNLPLVIVRLLHRSQIKKYIIIWDSY